MADQSVDTVKHKSHRERKSGIKAEKKKLKNPHEQELTAKQKNPKAFTFNSAIGAERRFRRKQDIDTKKTHIPLSDRTPDEPPPIYVAVVGPPKVGKSLVIQCLLKSFVNQPLTKILGPVTVVSGKKRRITFMECNNDINSMIDIAKVADLVLLLVDASFGFEMEIFEFLNICQVHGMPRIMGVLTHLDQIKNSRQLRKTKKTLKHRFWTEVYAGAKLFYLSGTMHGEYLRNEVKNLARFISVMKYRPLTWRSTHPYLVADRVEDLTPPEIIRQDAKVDRTVAIFGYVRGAPFIKESMIHVPGVGDHRISDINFLPDPCPLPDKLKRRALGEKERLIYAPFSGVGGVVYDKDAVYVELRGSHSHKQEDNSLMTGLIDVQGTLDQKLEQSELQLFSGAAPIKSQDVETISSELRSHENVVNNGRIRRKVIFDDTKDEMNGNESSGESDDDGDDEEEEEAEEFVAHKRDLSDDDENPMPKKPRNDDDELEAELTALRAENITENADNVEDKMDDDASDESCDDTKMTEINTENSQQSTVDTRNPIKNKIAEALKRFEEVSRQSKSKNTSDSDEMDDSFDELSDSDVINTSKLVPLNDEEFPDLNSKEDLEFSAREDFRNRQQFNPEKLVYGAQSHQPEPEEDRAEEVGEIFRVVSEQQKRKLEERELKNQEESIYFSQDPPRNWLLEDNKKLIFNKFVSGDWHDKDAELLLKCDDLEDDEELYGDYEDLETGEKVKAKRMSKKYAAREEEKTKNQPAAAAPKEYTAEEAEERQKLLEKKRQLKQQFDSEYDNTENKSYYDEWKQEVDKQAQLNKSEFENLDDEIRVQLEGYRAGMYVRIEVENIPCEFIENFDPNYPLIVGGLLHGEENIGVVNCKFKLHRWYNKILKSNDPLIISCGWRRFQIQATYAKIEDNMRHRYLKYTPKHVTCMIQYWGPITPQATGILAIQDVATKIPGFRIAGTGAVVELEKKSHIAKKLKLVGVPYKIKKKSAFIQGMFNSSLEVTKFLHAKIKTVSGIRGTIKHAESRPDGAFRAMFEDKIQLSDIVFLVGWYTLDIPKIYIPVTALLLPRDEKNQWRGMKTTGQLKREMGIKALPAKDSLYTPIERKPKMYTPLSVPKSLQKELPYRDKPKFKQLPEKRRIKFADKRVAVVRDAKEEKVADLMKRLRTTYDDKQLKLKQATRKRMAEYSARVEAEEMKKLKRQKELQKQVFRKMSKMEAKEAKKNAKY